MTNSAKRATANSGFSFKKLSNICTGWMRMSSSSFL
jgi:hypothetical protein